MSSAIQRSVAAVVAVLIVGTLTLFAQAPGKWLTTKFAPLPEPEEEYWNATTNGKVYLMGGNQGGRNDRVLEYDMASDKWTTKKQAPFSANHMALVGYRGKVYVAGGATVESQPNALKSWEYDPVADAWKELAAMPTKRTASVAIEAGGKIYVIGGSDEAGLSVGTNEVYDPATNKWVSKRPMPTARNHPAGGSIGGKIYVIGGRLTAANVANMVSSATDIVEEYDPATDKWRSTFQNRIYVAGGELRDSHMDAIFRDVVVFDPATNDWYRLPSMPTARHGVVLGALGNRLFAIGGHTAFNGNGAAALHTNVTEVFEFSSGTR
jgi:N-acetylneuraminic acid mutarotase